MAPMHRMDTAERRRRITVRHHLAPTAKANDIAQMAGDLVGIHATDPASVYLGTFARMGGLTRDAMAVALYDDRSVLKILGMRRTMFVVPLDLAAVVNSAVARTLAAAERKRLVQMLETAAVAQDVPAWIESVEAETVAALDELGGATASELTRRVAGLRVQIAFGEGKKWAGQVGVSTRLLFLLATEGRVIRGRPKGSWLSSMYEWVPMERWIGGSLAQPSVDEAQAELARRYLRTYGPATQRDVQWWTGWTAAATRKAIAAVEAVEVELDHGAGLVLDGDTEATSEDESWASLLPALDTTTMGWADRSWYLGEHGARIFDRNGNAGPSVWVDGRIVGGWAQRKSGEVCTRLLEDVGREATLKVEAEAARIEGWLGESRVIPRFRTPLELELS